MNGEEEWERRGFKSRATLRQHVSAGNFAPLTCPGAGLTPRDSADGTALAPAAFTFAVTQRWTRFDWSAAWMHSSMSSGRDTE